MSAILVMITHIVMDKRREVGLQVHVVISVYMCVRIMAAGTRRFYSKARLSTQAKGYSYNMFVEVIQG